MSNQQDGLASLGGVPIEYIGKKARKIDNVAGTGIEWAPGQIHIVPPLVAQKLTRYPDIWRAADPDAVNDDPSKVGMVVGDQNPLANTTAANPAAGQPTGQPGEPNGEPNGQQPQPQTFDLPNLQGMTKADLQTYAASQFNHQFGATEKKEDMINKIVTLANTTAANPAAGQ